jgi:putative transposase
METFHRKTCKRYDIAGQAHCLTFSCFDRQPFLSRPRSCLWLAEALETGRAKGLYDLWGYVFMPEHVHLVLLPHEGIKVSRILATVKSSVAKRALLWVRTHARGFLRHMADCQPSGRIQYRFWQRGGGYDRNLRTPSDVREKINYIHAHPVRRGLVTVVDGWYGSSFRAWQTGVDEPIPIDRESLMR